MRSALTAAESAGWPSSVGGFRAVLRAPRERRQREPGRQEKQTPGPTKQANIPAAVLPHRTVDRAEERIAFSSSLRSEQWPRGDAICGVARGIPSAQSRTNEIRTPRGGHEPPVAGQEDEIAPHRPRPPPTGRHLVGVIACCAGARPRRSGAGRSLGDPVDVALRLRSAIDSATDGMRVATLSARRHPREIARSCDAAPKRGRSGGSQSSCCSSASAEDVEPPPAPGRRPRLIRPRRRPRPTRRHRTGSGSGTHRNRRRGDLRSQGVRSDAPPPSGGA